MNRRDYVRDSCTCGECQQAGVSDVLQVRDPHSGKWLHGYELKRVQDAADRFLESYKAAMKPKGEQ